MQNFLSFSIFALKTRNLTWKTLKKGFEVLSVIATGDIRTKFITGHPYIVPDNQSIRFIDNYRVKTGNTLINKCFERVPTPVIDSLHIPGVDSEF